ncbi:MAG: tetratricopeptide repeat protein, partial [Solibacillus sp.]
MMNRDLLTNLCNAIPETHRPLAEALQSAARYTISNPTLSLKKLNIALSIIVRDLYEKEMNKSGGNADLRTLLLNKGFADKIHPRRIYLLMNLIKNTTVISTNSIVDTKAAKIALEYSIDLASWYIKHLTRGERLAQAAYLDLDEMYTAPPLAKLNFPEHDYEEAARWFLVSANNGDSNAQYNLGFLYNHGNGVRKNYLVAAKWYTLAAEQ